MAHRQTSTSDQEVDQLVFDLESPSKELVTEIRSRAMDRVTDVSRDSEVRIWAEVKTSSKRDVVPIAKWTAAELYAYSSGTLIEFLNAVDDVRAHLDQMNPSAPTLIFEAQIIEFVRKLRNLRRFASLSPAHEELAATFLIISSGDNAEMTSAKLVALKSLMINLSGMVAIGDEDLNSFDDSLEDAGFDLNLPMSSADDLRCPTVNE